MSETSRAMKKKEGGIAETGRVIFHALIIALVIRTFLFQPFNIPSGSMKETPVSYTHLTLPTILRV